MSTIRLNLALLAALSLFKRSLRLAERTFLPHSFLWSHLARLSFIAFAVRTSFASQLPTMVDRNMAIDQAFMVCRTEESKLQAFENTLSENPSVSNAAHRNTLREELLRR
jgi:hypothetical protein